MASTLLSDLPSSSHQSSLIMASRSLSDLPSELVLGIYETFDDHHTITALNLTSRKFYDIWRLNTATITKAVLPRAIDCFDLAQELLVVQGRSPDGGQAGTREAMLERSKHLLKNAAVALNDYTSSVLVFDAGEYEASIQSHYRIWIAYFRAVQRSFRAMQRSFALAGSNVGGTSAHGQSF